MLLSKSSTYALRACLYLARHNQNGYLSIRSIADNLEISFHFLTKIFQQLTQAGILQSYKGPSGGVTFARSISEISLLQIVAAVEGTDLFTECILGLPDCGNDHPCPMHADWMTERIRLQRMFQGKTVLDLHSETEEHPLRLVSSKED